MTAIRNTKQIVHSVVCACVRVCVRVCVNVCVRASVRARARARVCLCVNQCRQRCRQLQTADVMPQQFRDTSQTKVSGNLTSSLSHKAGRLRTNKHRQKSTRLKQQQPPLPDPNDPKHTPDLFQNCFSSLL